MKPFWFAFNVTDWLSSKSVRLMSLAERGAYIGLLTTAWGEEVPGTLPVDTDEVRRLAEMSPEQWAVSGPCLLKKFPLSECGTFRYNPRLLAEGQEQKRKSELAAEAGRRSAEAKKQRKGNGTSTDVAKKPTDVEKTATECQLVTYTITSSSNEEEGEQNPSSSATHLKAELGGQALVAAPPADPAKAAALATTDPADEQPWQESPLTKPVPFQVICERHPFGKGIAYEHYRQLALAAVEGTDTARTIKQWQSWIFKFLENQKPKGGQLLTPADLARETQTGVRAPQHPNAPNHKPRPEVQAKRDADFEAQKQLRIAANLARNAADGLSQQTQPGGVARTF